MLARSLIRPQRVYLKHPCPSHLPYPVQFPRCMPADLLPVFRARYSPPTKSLATRARRQYPLLLTSIHLMSIRLFPLYPPRTRTTSTISLPHQRHGDYVEPRLPADLPTRHSRNRSVLTSTLVHRRSAKENPSHKATFSVPFKPSSDWNLSYKRVCCYNKSFLDCLFIV